MKSMKKIKNILFSILVVALIGVTALSVNAAAKTIQLGTAKKITTGYIAGVTFSTKVTTDGRYLYCVDMHHNTASNVSANLVREMDRGIAEIINNGYPNKSITGNAEKDYYITQTAVWWYLDEVTGSSNLGEEFKKNGSDAYGMRSKVKELVELGKKYRNQAQPTTEFSLYISNNALQLHDGYYVSQPITISKINNVSSYSVVVENAPEGTLVVDKNGNNIERFTKDTVFYVKVPADKVESIETEFKFTAKATGYTYRAYEYQPTDKNMQNVALLEKVATTIPATITLSIDSPKVSVTKIDSNTKNPIEGAKLVLKDSSGKEITSWVSTTKSHVIRNLANGTYTIEEIEAPKGYVINNKITTFTITDTNNNIDITIENAPEAPPAVYVPDTSTTSVLLTILGLAILGSGLGFVYKNGKKTN